MAVALTDRQRFFANQYGVDRELFQRCRGLHLQIGTTNWRSNPLSLCFTSTIGVVEVPGTL
jgi:hypothetical protein